MTREVSASVLAMVISAAGSIAQQTGAPVPEAATLRKLALEVTSKGSQQQPHFWAQAVLAKLAVERDLQGSSEFSLAA